MKRLFLSLAVVGMLFTASATAQTNSKVIKFEDAKVKQICISRWDTNYDRELSYEEAAAVTDLGYAFKGKEVLTLDELEYFTGLTSLNKYEFKDCISLASITIPNSITSIKDYAFAGCAALTSVTIPDSVTSIGRETFSGCASLTSVTIGKSVTSIGLKAFVGCRSLKKVYYTGDLSAWCKITFTHFVGTPLSAAAKLYIDGVEQTNITIPSDITQIKSNTFFGCSSLTSVTIPNSVTSIGDKAFSQTLLTSVTIPDSVTSIESGAFMYCRSLTKVYCKPTTPPAIGSMSLGNAAGLKIYVPRNSVEAYKSAEAWASYANYIEGYDF